METDLVTRLFLGAVLFGSGILLIWMARATASGRIKRNHLIGFRTPTAMASDEAWLVVHIRAQTPVTIAGFVGLVAGLIVLIPMPYFVLAVIVIPWAVFTLTLVFYGAHVGAQAVRDLHSSQIDEQPEY